eukprot:1143565-Pelagomonas_calceolata.AAC.2
MLFPFLDYSFVLSSWLLGDLMLLSTAATVVASPFPGATTAAAAHLVAIVGLACAGLAWQYFP